MRFGITILPEIEFIIQNQINLNICIIDLIPLPVSKYAYLSLLSAFIFTIFIILDGLTQNAQAKIETSIKLNPNKVSAGEKLDVYIIIENKGNETEKLNTIELVTPWQNLQLLKNPVLLNSTRIFDVSPTQIKTPETVKPGTYNLIVIVKTNESDASSTTELSVTALQGISLSGEIPFAIISIVTPGILTYFIIVYVQTRKFDRGYIEIGLLV